MKQFGQKDCSQSKEFKIKLFFKRGSQWARSSA